MTAGRIAGGPTKAVNRAISPTIASVPASGGAIKVHNEFYEAVTLEAVQAPAPGL